MKHVSEPDLTVIIPSWNQRELLRRCLESLRAQSTHCLVMVVDDGSVDGTLEMVQKEFPEVTCIRQYPNGGFAKAVNLGIRSSNTPWIALLNNDTEADTHWVEAGIRALSSMPQYGFFASRMVDFHRRSELNGAGDLYSRTGLATKRGAGEPVEAFDRPEPVLGASAGAAFYRRELFHTVGLFDEDLVMYLEDVDLSLRAQLAGFPCLYLPDAVVYHIEAASDPDRSEQAVNASRTTSLAFYSDRRVFWITRNRWILMVQYQPLRNAPWLVYGWTRSLLFHLLRAGHFGAFLKGVASGMRATPSAFRKRMNFRRLRARSLGSLCKLMTWS